MSEVKRRPGTRFLRALEPGEQARLFINAAGEACAVVAHPGREPFIVRLDKPAERISIGAIARAS